MMPLSDLCWARIVDARGNVQGKSFWMSRRTYVALLAERPGRSRRSIYATVIMFDDAMTFGHITLERRAVR